MSKHHRTFEGVYENMDFPPYVFKEYPKMVYLDEEKTKYEIVNNAAEELAIADKLSRPTDTAMIAQQRDAVANALVAKETALAAKDAEIAALKAQIESAQQINAESAPKDAPALASPTKK